MRHAPLTSSGSSGTWSPLISNKTVPSLSSRGCLEALLYLCTCSFSWASKSGGGRDGGRVPRSSGSATGGGGTGGTRPPIFESAGDNPPIFRKIVGQIRWVFGFWYGLPLKKILASLPPGPRPPIFIGVAEPLPRSEKVRRGRSPQIRERSGPNPVSSIFRIFRG